MKKILSIVLALVMVFALSTTAFAAGAKTDEGLGLVESSNNVDVIIDSTTVENITAVYYVDVEWESLDFTYTFDKTVDNVWDPETHTYTVADGEDGNANWDKTSATITVTNHSNEAVAIAATAPAAMNGVTTSVTAGFDLPSAVGYAVDAAEITDTFTVSIDGIPTVEENFTIGAVTVTISAK